MTGPRAVTIFRWTLTILGCLAAFGLVLIVAHSEPATRRIIVVTPTVTTTAGTS